MNSWLGLDTSLAAFGYAACCYDLRAQPAVVEIGTWRTQADPHEKLKTKDVAARVRHLADCFIDLIERVRPEAVFVEGLAYVPGNGFLTVSALGRVRGLVEGICVARGLQIIEFKSNDVRRWLLGKPKGEKHEVASVLNRLYPGLEQKFFKGRFTVHDWDATDALAIAHLGATRGITPAKPNVVSHRPVVDGGPFDPTDPDF